MLLPGHWLVSARPGSGLAFFKTAVFYDRGVRGRAMLNILCEWPRGWPEGHAKGVRISSVVASLSDLAKAWLAFDFHRYRLPLTVMPKGLRIVSCNSVAGYIFCRSWVVNVEGVKVSVPLP